jgi:hypothetical protein
MSILKSEVKIGTVHELGCRLDDSLDAATREMYKGEGAAEALHQATAAFEKFAKNVDEEIREGITDLESARFVKRYIGLMLNALTSMEKSAESAKMANVGRVHAFKQAVQIAKQMKDEEMTKLQLLQTALQKGILQKDDGSFVKANEVPASDASPAEAPSVVQSERSGPKRPERIESAHPGMSLKQQRLAEELVQPNPPVADSTATKAKAKRTKK